MGSNNLKYIPEYSSGSASGSQNSLETLLNNSVEGSKNELHVLVREHIQNSLDAYEERKNKPEKLIFNVTRKQIDSSYFKLNELKKIFEECYNYKKTQAGENYKIVRSISSLKKTIDSLNSKKEKMWVTIIEDNGCGLDGSSRILVKDKKKQRSAIILDEGDTNKFSSDKRGAFGVGKLTAFTNNDSYTVFYLNSRDNKNYLIGKTKLESYVDNNGYTAGPNIFFGVETKNNQGIEMSDWYEMKDEKLKNSLRSIKGDGLCTIIPSFNEFNDKQWINEVSYSIIHSYFKVFEDNDIECTLKDEFTDQKIFIDNKNYREEYIKSENLDFIKNDINDEYNYHLVRPFVTQESQYSYTCLEEEIKVTNEFKGKAIFHFYKNQKLEELIESANKTGFNQTFRFIRKNMLIRAYLLPRKRLFEPSHCGYIEFKNESLNKILAKGETQSHDNIDKKRYHDTSDGVPAYQTLEQFFWPVINKIIKNKIDDLNGHNDESNQEYNVDLGLIDGFNKKHKNPTFSNYLIDTNQYSTLLEKNNASGKENGNDDNESSVTGNVDPNQKGKKGKIVETGRIGKKKGNKTKSKGGKSKRNRLIDPGLQEGERLQKLSKIEFYSKIVNKDNDIHNYSLQLQNVIDNVNILLSQEQQNDFLFYELKGVKINGKDFYDYSEKKTNGYITGYYFDNIEPKSKKINISVIIKEPSKTETKLKIVVS